MKNISEWERSVAGLETAAVVTRDIPPNSIAAGVPARVIREIDSGDLINVWDTYLQNEVPLSARKKQIK